MKRIYKSLKIIQNPIKEMNQNNFVETEEVYNFSWNDVNIFPVSKDNF